MIDNLQLNRLQQIQNSLARAAKATKSTRITPILKYLRWLKVYERFSLTYKVFTTAQPGLEVRRYGPVWHTGTSLVGLKAYRHFFLARCHTGMP